MGCSPCRCWVVQAQVAAARILPVRGPTRRPVGQCRRRPMAQGFHTASAEDQQRICHAEAHDGGVKLVADGVRSVAPAAPATAWRVRDARRTFRAWAAAKHRRPAFQRDRKAGKRLRRPAAHSARPPACLRACLEWVTRSKARCSRHRNARGIAWRPCYRRHGHWRCTPAWPPSIMRTRTILVEVVS